MSLLRLEVTDGEVGGALLAAGVEVRRVSTRSQSPWRGLLDASLALVTDPEARPTSLEIGGAADTLAVWDEETLGSVRPVAFGVDPAVGLRELETAEPHTWTHLQEGRYVVGGVASYLVARVTRGVHHVTDPAWAAAPGLADAGVPASCLPVVTTAPVGPTDPGTFLGLALPVRVTGLP